MKTDLLPRQPAVRSEHCALRLVLADDLINHIPRSVPSVMIKPEVRDVITILLLSEQTCQKCPWWSCNQPVVGTKVSTRSSCGSHQMMMMMMMMMT